MGEGDSLQDALDAAQPGDTILLAQGVEFVGTFVLPVKSGADWITVRTSTADTVLPGPGVRIHPAHAPLLARLRSSVLDTPALRTAPGAHHWDIRYLEFGANPGGTGDVIQLGDGSSAQNAPELVPHHIVLNHVYVHGDPVIGQKRCIALNAADVTISDSYVSDCKSTTQDSQAIAGWNGPGPFTTENNYLEAAGENVMFWRIGSGDRRSRAGRHRFQAEPRLAADVVAGSDCPDTAGRQRGRRNRWIAARGELRLPCRCPGRGWEWHHRSLDCVSRSDR